jgi:hypothetical protein
MIQKLFKAFKNKSRLLLRLTVILINYKGAKLKHKAPLIMN